MVANVDNNGKQPKDFTLKILRQDKAESEPYWQLFRIPYKLNLNIISVLQYIAEHPRTVEGQDTTPVAYDCACLEEVCGSCTMNINGRVRQACSTLVDELLEDSDEILLEPMKKFPVVRDLFVDRQRMFDQLKRIKGWVPTDGLAALGPGPKESPEKAELRYELSRCMTCGCCLEACPQFQLDNDFIGAQAIGQVIYFNEHATGSVLKEDRVDVLMDPAGVSDCGNSQNCVKVCPKEVPLTIGIAKAGRQVTVQSIKQFFSGKKRT